MSEKFKNKYRIESARLPDWNYEWDGSYFITICTKTQLCFFGEIEDKQFIKNEIGHIAQKYWNEIPQHFPYIELDEFVIMPNHVHGIITIDKNNNGMTNRNDVNIRDTINRNDVNIRDAINRVSTGGGLETKNDIGGFAKQKNPMLNENISRVIRWYKGRVCFESRKKNTEFAWQPRFHDHIIRNTQSYEKIKNYIIENPSKWTDDKFYKP